MPSSGNLKELNRDSLLSGLDRSKRKAVESVMLDADVQYIVLLESSDKTRRNLLTVGLNLEYPSLEAVADVEIDGLRPAGYLDNRNVKTKGSLFRSKTSHENRRLELLVEQLQSENRTLKARYAETHEKLLELQDRESEMNRLIVYNQCTKEDLDSRERDLHKMEEELMSHMNQLVEKQTEMEQWEENMFARERAFLEKQSGPKKQDRAQRPANA